MQCSRLERDRPVGRVLCLWRWCPRSTSPRSTDGSITAMSPASASSLTTEPAEPIAASPNIPPTQPSSLAVLATTFPITPPAVLARLSHTSPAITV
mmetsp:Transcript_10410/g.22171  ORF Transcript_10410/g.22171 Transcript_10410/m.22171 type:complete len:96 (-) Transcript_10410:189-476(-)